MEHSRDKGGKRKASENGNKSDSSKKKKMDSVMAEAAATEMNTIEFAASRAREIEAMTSGILNSNMNHRIYQRLPKHMRRRAMSHDPKRMPRRLREAHKHELEIAQTKPVSKRPSRRHRRRPKNLLSEYERRKRNNMWLETHIWHAKRFHMSNKWGYRIPLYPNDKGSRAAYKAVSRNCLLHDLSYMCCIEVTGQEADIISAFSHLTDKATGLSIGAKSVISGCRQGHITLYEYHTYPHGVIGPATYIWKATNSPGPCPMPFEDSLHETLPQDTIESNTKRQFWIWIHPACYGQVLNQLRKAIGIPPELESDPAANKEHPEGTSTTDTTSREAGATRSEDAKGNVHLVKSKVVDSPVDWTFGNDKLRVVSLKDELIRFRFRGPLSQKILSELLFPADVNSTCKDKGDSKWWQKYYGDEINAGNFSTQKSTWELLKTASTPSLCSSNAVVGLTVRDPRVLLPKKKTHFTNLPLEPPASHEHALKLCQPYPLDTCISPIWDREIREHTNNKLSTHEINTRRSELLVPGTDLHLGQEESRIPVLLIQNPGTIKSKTTKQGVSGYGSGWDLIAPAGWGMAFWQGAVFRGARAAGLREFMSESLEMKTLYFPRDFPDGKPGKIWAEEHQKEAEKHYCNRPPSKRANFVKLSVCAPFRSPWSVLVHLWKNTDDKNTQPVTDSPTFYTLRDRTDLDILAKYCSGDVQVTAGIDKKNTDIVESFRSEQYLDGLVAVSLSIYGQGNISEMAMICIPTKKDMEDLKCNKKYAGPLEPIEKADEQPQLPKGKKIAKKDQVPRNALPNLDITSVTTSCSRDIIGFVTSGGFSLVRGASSGIGFCAVQGLLQLEAWHRMNRRLLVLIRETHSNSYKFAYLSILL